METDAGPGCVQPDVALLAEFRSWLCRERGLSPVSVQCYSKQAKPFLAWARRGRSGQRPGRGEGDRVHGGLDGGPEHVVGEGDGDVAAGVPAVRARDGADGRPAGGGGSRGRVVAGVVAAPGPEGGGDRAAAGAAASGTRLRACGTTRSCRCWPGWACGAPRPPGCSSATSTGGPGRSRLRARAARRSGCPLPALAGEALAAWLTDGRPECESRSVFVTVRRPFRPLTPESVRAVMARACDRAGMERRGTHRFRHALATEMLRAGASLPEVGQVLRHRSMLSTTLFMPRSTRTRCARWPASGPGARA